MSYPAIPIGEVARLQSGYAFKSRDWSDSGVAVVRIKNVKDGNLDLTDCAYVSEEVAKSAQKYRLHPGDILFSMTGYIGERAWVRSNDWIMLNQRVGRFVFDQKRSHEIDKKYLFYAINFSPVLQELQNRAHGAAQPNISPKAVGEVSIPAPSLDGQRKIASILSTYDDLIENNTRRIEILEEMARRLYEEWFVHFRFPGHEEVSFKKSELGFIPEGWEFVQLCNLVDEVKGAIPPSRVAPDTPYVGLEHIPRRSITLKEWSTADTVESSKLPFKKGDILFGKIRPYFHKVSVAPVDGICSSDTILLRVKKSEYFGLALCYSSSDEFVAHATQTANGTKMPRANWKVLSQYPLVLPNEDLLKTFNYFFSDLVSQCRTLIFKNNNLRAQRDLLLPRLVSGEIGVADITMPEDKEVEAA